MHLAQHLSCGELPLFLTWAVGEKHCFLNLGGKLAGPVAVIPGGARVLPFLPPLLCWDEDFLQGSNRAPRAYTDRRVARRQETVKTTRGAFSLVAWTLADQVMGTKALCVSIVWPIWASLVDVWFLILTAGLSSMASYSSGVVVSPERGYGPHMGSRPGSWGIRDSPVGLSQESRNFFDKGPHGK